MKSNRFLANCKFARIFFDYAVCINFRISVGKTITQNLQLLQIKKKSSPKF